jgi:hypothetical protein
VRTLTTVRPDAFDQWCCSVEHALAQSDDDGGLLSCEALVRTAPALEAGLDPAERADRLARLTKLTDAVHARRMALLTELVSVTEERRALASRGRALARYLADGGQADDEDFPQG